MHRIHHSPLIPVLLILCLVMPGCAPRISLFSTGGDRLEPYVLSGESSPCVALIHVRGVLSMDPDSGLLGERPSMVQEVASRLAMAAQDPDVAAVVLAVDSPGGSVTASDVLHEMVRRHKEETGQKVVAAFMTIAASGGYYMSASADEIVAHPTTITGSIGTIMLLPRITGLMDTLGIEVEAIRSGEFKDMASPFRATTDQERSMLQAIIESHNARFLQVVAEGRGLTDEQVAAFSDARILTAQQALNLGLVDSLGYLDDALDRAKELAGLADDARVIVYRRAEEPDDTAYNTSMALSPAAPSLVGAELTRFLAVPRTGFYYLWAPEFTQ